MEEKLEKNIKNKILENKEWQELVCNIIKFIPETQYKRVNYLLNEDNFTENLDVKEIIGIIETVKINAENGVYCDNLYYDHSFGDVVVEGDESWLDEIDKVLNGAKKLFKQKKYEQVIEIYENVLGIIDGKYEDYYNLLPCYYNVGDNLKSNLKEHYMKYLEAVYHCEKINKVERFANIFATYVSVYNNEDIIHDFCNKYEDFSENMSIPIAKELEKVRGNNVIIDSIKFKLLIEKNGIQSVMEFLIDGIDQNMIVYKFLCNYLFGRGKYEELLECLYTLENTTIQTNNKKKIYMEIIGTAEAMQNNEVRVQYLSKLNKIEPSLENTIEICKQLLIEDKVKMLEELNANFIVNKENEIEKLLLELTLGRIDRVYESYQKMDKYKKESIEYLITLYMLKFGSNEMKEKRLLTCNLKNEISNIYNRSNSLDSEEIMNIMAYTKNNNIPNEFVKEIEIDFADMIERVTKTVLTHQRREEYMKIATYFAILMEHFYQENRESEAIELLRKNRIKYKKYSLYYKYINKKMNESSAKFYNRY